MKIRLKLASLVLLLFVLTNCIKENECCCSQDYTVLGLKFRYATNKSIHQQTEFPPNAMLAVFIFDDKGTFVSQINDSLNQVNDDYTMKLPFKQGSYQFVAWTGYDETCYQLSACIPQQTDIHDFFLSLKREKDNQTINQPSLLYHGIHDIVKIREGKENIVWIDLKQITNHIQVIVHNLNDKKKHIIYIEDNNGKYDSFLQYADDEKINLESFAAGKIDCLLTCKKVSEGIDISSVTNIILFSSDRSRLVTTQRIGRALRLDKNNPEKKATVVDFVIEDSEENDNNADADRAEWLTDLSQTRRCEHEK